MSDWGPLILAWMIGVAPVGYAGYLLGRLVGPEKDGGEDAPESYWCVRCERLHPESMTCVDVPERKNSAGIYGEKWRQL